MLRANLPGRSRPAAFPSRNRATGFSLTEMLIAIAIVSILAAVAVPNLRTFLQNIKLNSAGGAVGALLQQARGEAVKMNGRVLVCARNSAGTDCDTNTDWARTGMIACYDVDGDGACDASTTANPNPFRVERGIDSATVSVTGPAVPIRFNPTGSQGAVGAGTVTLTVAVVGASSSAVTVTVTGAGLIKSGRK